jgi:hypothetical protein
MKIAEPQDSPLGYDAELREAMIDPISHQVRALIYGDKKGRWSDGYPIMTSPVTSIRIDANGTRASLGTKNSRYLVTSGPLLGAPPQDRADATPPWRRDADERIDELLRANNALVERVRDAERRAAASDAQLQNVHARYLIWSNANGAWWRPKSAGYTTHLSAAGIYTRDEAIAISGRCRDGWRDPSQPPTEIAVREADALAAIEKAKAPKVTP